MVFAGDQYPQNWHLAARLKRSDAAAAFVAPCHQDLIEKSRCLTSDAESFHDLTRLGDKKKEAFNRQMFLIFKPIVNLLNTDLTSIPKAVPG